MVDYSRKEQAKVAEEVVALPDGSIIAAWLADYAVLRDQVRACGAVSLGFQSESWRNGSAMAILLQ